MLNSSGAWNWANKLLSNRIVKIPTTIRNATETATNVHAYISTCQLN